MNDKPNCLDKSPGIGMGYKAVDETVETTEADAPSTEERILEAAEREFMSKGYDGARTTAIAEAAGVTHAMLHYYFRTKDKLFDKIIESKIGTLRNIMLASLGDRSIPLFEKLQTAVESHFDFVANNPDLPRFMINEVLRSPERMQVVVETLKYHAPIVVESLQRQIDEYTAKGLCRKTDAVMLMLDILSLNIFPFTAAPMVKALLGGTMEDAVAFAAARKKENVETIMRKIRL